MNRPRKRYKEIREAFLGRYLGMFQEEGSDEEVVRLIHLYTTRKGGGRVRRAIAFIRVCQLLLG